VRTDTVADVMKSAATERTRARVLAWGTSVTAVFTLSPS
jgi:hypothetical protein